MLTYDPTPWLMKQEGLAAVRARRMLGIARSGDAQAVDVLVRDLSLEQSRDGSFADSPMKTAGVLNLLDDLGASDGDDLIDKGATYLLAVLESQPGHTRTQSVKPGSLRTPCDLAGFFGPYEDRDRPEALADGAREMNFYREYEPLFGPNKPVRGERSSPFDRSGPGSCYTWGLIPLAYTLEALCRAGRDGDERLQPAIDVLLGAQRGRGGWCRNLGGHPSCSIHAIRVLGSSPMLRSSETALRAVEFMRASQLASVGQRGSWWRGANLFAALHAVAAFAFPVADDIIVDTLAELAPRQRRNGAFGTPCQVERVTAVLTALRHAAADPERAKR
jgi:hypothetical protein